MNKKELVQTAKQLIASPSCCPELKTVERQDYIFRVPSVEDARLKSIKLTEKGRTIMHEVLEARQKLLTQLKGDISDEDIRKFTAICDEMIHEFGDWRQDGKTL